MQITIPMPRFRINFKKATKDVFANVKYENDHILCKTNFFGIADSNIDKDNIYHNILCRRNDFKNQVPSFDLSQIKYFSKSIDCDAANHKIIMQNISHNLK